MLEESVDYVGDTLFKEIEEENFETETVSVSSFKYDLKKRDGRYLPKYIRNLSLIKSLEIRSDDAFIIGYPKSGRKSRYLILIISITYKLLGFYLRNNMGRKTCLAY